jgi:AcrR family transcriptional regulator
MSAQKREYTMRKRAESVEATRRRITEAAVELHGSVGPSRTTISAIADRAGVQRHTVYRHFPTENDLYDACSARFGALHPGPDVDAWGEIDDPEARLVRVLGDLYGFYEDTEAMWTNVLRDAPLVEAAQRANAPFRTLVATSADVIATGRGARGGRAAMVRAAAVHVVQFETWRSLARDGGATRDQAVELSAAMVRAAA